VEGVSDGCYVAARDHVSFLVFIFGHKLVASTGKAKLIASSAPLKYGIFATNDTEALVCTYRSARAMAFQGPSPERSNIVQLTEDRWCNYGRQSTIWTGSRGICTAHGHVLATQVGLVSQFHSRLF
jgi:hypothetical protein